ncbi:MAG TPA: NAD(P)-binding domain-containing protein [Methanothermobacter sp.]|nr:NAD(P)-binding domain-containing protein [Methanothermobacter sp.]
MRVVVIGAGSFGTAMAQVLSENVEKVYLVARRPEVVETINMTRENSAYHPGVKLRDNIEAILIDDDTILGESEYVFLAVPSKNLRSIVKSLDSRLEDKKIVSCIKGIEYPSLKLMSSVIMEETSSGLVFSVSGPNFADELIRGMMSGMTIGADCKHAEEIAGLLRSPGILLDFSENVQGVEFCGILKNVYAVAMGILDGQIMGENQRYSLLTLCFREMVRILDNMGYGELYDKFCGFGDFLLTASADKSRNRTLGLMLGKRMSLSENSTVTVESFKAIRAIRELTEGLDLPVLELVHRTMDDPENVSIYIKDFQRLISDSR